MTKIKKTIDIILISVAIAVVVVLADRIIPFRTLNASLNPEGESDTEDASYGITDQEKQAVDLKTDLVIDERLFIPEKDIFVAVPPIGGGEDEGSEEDDQETPTTAQENNDQSQEADQAEDAGNIVNETQEETPENNQETVLQGDNIDYSNSEDFRIEIDLARQRVIVFHKDDILKEMICSGGASGSPTPLGEYLTSEKIEYAWVERFGVGAYYWIRFFEDYLIHSVPFDESGEMIVEEFEKLGNPASHGCVRLRLEEAKWLYETLPLGVKVVIY